METCPSSRERPSRPCHHCCAIVAELESHAKIAIPCSQVFRAFPLAPHLAEIPLILKRLECVDRRTYDLKVRRLGCLRQLSIDLPRVLLLRREHEVTHCSTCVGLRGRHFSTFPGPLQHRLALLLLVGIFPYAAVSETQRMPSMPDPTIHHCRKPNTFHNVYFHNM